MCPCPTKSVDRVPPLRRLWRAAGNARRRGPLAGLLAALLALGSLPAAAAIATASQLQLEPRNLRLATHNLPPGFGNVAVRDVLQDDSGFVWIATERGLLQFNGTNHQLFDYSRSMANPLRADSISDLLVTAAGTLWAASTGGIDRFDASRQQFVPYNLPPAAAVHNDLLAAGVTHLLEDQYESVWVALAEGGLLVIPDQREDAPEYFPRGVDGLPAEPVTALLQDSKGNLWVGTEFGLRRHDRRDSQFLNFDPLLVTDGVVPAITALYEDDRGRLWIGTAAHGLLRFDSERQTFRRYQHDPEDAASISSDQVNAILTDHLGSLWIATNAGLNELRDDGFFRRYESDPEAPWNLNDDLVHCLLLDRNQVLWVGTGRGISRWNYLSDTFHYLGNQVQRRLITGIAERANGDLWLASQREGLIQLRRKAAGSGQRQATNEPLPSDRISAIVTDAEDNLWIGFADAGLARLSAGSDRLQRITWNGTTDYAVTKLAVDQRRPPAAQQLWVAIDGAGLFALRPGEAPEPTLSLRQINLATDAIDLHAISALESSQSGQLWIGTSNGAIGSLDPNAEALTMPPPLTASGEPILSLLESRSGDLWIGTREAGLLQLPAAQLQGEQTALNRFNRIDGLASERVDAILEDDSGALWLSSNRGLTLFDPQSLRTRRFRREQGLRDDRFYTGAAMRARSGELLFGSRGGLVAFYPSAIDQQTDDPPLVLAVWHRSEFLGQVLSETAEELSLSLSAKETAVEFRFAALDTRNPGTTRFQYQLMGFDDDWIDPQLQRTATYTNLSSGAYRFRVRALGSDGRSGSAQVEIGLQIAPPAWRQPLALAGYVTALLLAIAYLIAVLRSGAERQRRTQRDLEIQVEARTIELEERNQQLEELNERLQEASVTDPLTGLLNRRSFYEFVAREVARVERTYTGVNTDDVPEAERRLLYFMMIDLDEFKPINDTFGHHTGDRTLVQVSDLLRSCAREADTVFRWGGDEFLVIGEAREHGDMGVLAERFRRTIADHRFDPKYGKALRLSASIGVAAYPFCIDNPGVASWEQVADVADLAALLAKTHGKNGWVATHGTTELTATQVQHIKHSFEQLIESGRIVAVTSDMDVPIRGANRAD